MATGIQRIAAERQRQIDKERWDSAHDSRHTNDELARAAAAYATPRRFRVNLTSKGKPKLFPWSQKWWKPAQENDNTRAGRIRELEKAGALIAAEIDRMQNRYI